MYEFFSEESDPLLFTCPETGEKGIRTQFVRRLDMLRRMVGFPLYVTSGYRSPQHSIEAAKERPGYHAQGVAADLKVDGGVQRRRLVYCALHMNFKGVGVYETHVHVDDRDDIPMLWAG